MKCKAWLIRIYSHSLPPQKLIEQIMEVWLQVRKRIPREQQVDFLKNVAEKYLGLFLVDLSREERTVLMNALLPLATREFPLTNLDFLTSFSSPHNGYRKKGAD